MFSKAYMGTFLASISLLYFLKLERTTCFLVHLAVGAKYWLLGLIQFLSQTMSFSCFLKQDEYHVLNCTVKGKNIFHNISSNIVFNFLHLGHKIMKVLNMNRIRFVILSKVVLQSEFLSCYIVLWTHSCR